MSDITTYVLYHGDCPDGLGGAYAAWKKYGTGAIYVPLFDRTTPPKGLEGGDVYMIDYSFPAEVLQDLEARVNRLVVLDHHAAVRDAVCALKEHIFDNDRSGAHIAWDYFHPGVPLPRLLAYIEDQDLWRHALPHTHEVQSYLAVHYPHDFDEMDKMVQMFEHETDWRTCVEHGQHYRVYFDSLCRRIADRAQPVQFDEYEVYAANCTDDFTSEVGHLLATEHPPFGVVWYLRGEQWHVSLRGDGTIDLATLAQRYGGNGHHDAAAFRVPYPGPLPFVHISKKE